MLASLYQLSFTLVTSRVEKKARNYAEEHSLLAKQSDAFKKLSDNRKNSFLDSIEQVAERHYLDSVASLGVYPFGLFTYKESQEKEINLGLDLKGGMNVMLEVSVIDIIQAMAENNRTDPDFIAATQLALKNQGGSGKDMVTLFGEAWEQVAPGKPLSKIFGTFELKDRIKPESTNKEVIQVIKENAESAVANSFNIIRNRIDRFGVTSPNVQRIGNTGRILVELPGIKEPERVRKLLQGTANLEFWETYSNAPETNSPGMFHYLQLANSKIAELKGIDEAAVNSATVDEQIAAAADSTVAATDSIKSDDLLTQLQAEKDSILLRKNFEKQNPLFAMLSPLVDPQTGNPFVGANIGYVSYRDTAEVSRWLNHPQVRSLFPSDFVPAWSIKPDKKTGTMFELIALKASGDRKAKLDGGAIKTASQDFDPTNGEPVVSMSMNPEGTRQWARMTADNIGKSIAIVLDGYVYSYPNVLQEIPNGQSRITGQFTPTEAEDLANVLRSGKLPVPARIVQEAVVGPSLGAESISAGMFSFILAFILVLVYMWFYYNTAGFVANIALLSNVLLLFGTLASFGAVLTLPGIAGIVLSLGMAVDANVLIYERIKEEIRAGKGLRVAVAEGYKHALSAIIDGQITTLIVGIILFLFGSGPVQGFATTLIIGIVTSLATSIFVTRLVFEWMLDKNKKISFGNKLTFDFMKETKLDFMKIRKYAYVFSLVMITAGAISIGVKGFSYGVDFTGGRTYIVRFDQDAKINEIRSSLDDVFGQSLEVKQFGPSSQVKITTKYKIEDQSEDIDKEVEAMLYKALNPFFSAPLTYEEFLSTQTNPNGIISSEKVGPTIADDLKVKAVFAVLFSLIAIFVYIAIRFKKWQWGFGGVVSLAHDAMLMISVFSIFAGILPFSMDIDQQFIAAILTIIGYSINDTVVIFDRIREYRILYPKRDLYQNINHAINSTIMRTINTSMTVLIVLIAIFIFGGEIIRGFSFALIIGVIMGCYSTLFIAIAVSYEFLKKGDSERIKREEKEKKKLA